MLYAIGVGSNCGDRAATIASAAIAVEDGGFCRVHTSSRLVETAPVGGPRGQGMFLNGVWVLESRLGPHQLLAKLQALERRFARVRSVEAGPRTLDCDLLLREDGACCCSPVLTLPHPRLHQRSFVLRPLVEVAGDWRHPWFACSVAELWMNFPGVVG